jgi:hypothetical protein
MITFTKVKTRIPPFFHSYKSRVYFSYFSLKLWLRWKLRRIWQREMTWSILWRRENDGVGSSDECLWGRPILVLTGSWPIVLTSQFWFEFWRGIMDFVLDFMSLPDGNFHTLEGTRGVFSFMSPHKCLLRKPIPWKLKIENWILVSLIFAEGLGKAFMCY